MVPLLTRNFHYPITTSTEILVASRPVSSPVLKSHLYGLLSKNIPSIDCLALSSGKQSLRQRLNYYYLVRKCISRV